MKLHPLIIEALKMMREQVNLTDGLSHPNDKERAAELLLLLYEEKNLGFNPELIEQWCLDNRWGRKAANEIYFIAFTVKAVLDRKLSGRVYRFFRPDVIKSLRRQIQGSQK